MKNLLMGIVMAGVCSLAGVASAQTHWQSAYMIDPHPAPLSQVEILEYGAQMNATAPEINLAALKMLASTHQLIVGSRCVFYNGSWFYWSKDWGWMIYRDSAWFIVEPVKPILVP